MISTKSTNPILSEAKCTSHEEQGVEGGGAKRVINNIMKRLLEFASQIHFLGQVTSFKIMDFLHDSFFRSQNHIFTWQLINVYLLFHDYFVSPSLTEKDSCKRQGFKAK